MNILCHIGLHAWKPRVKFMGLYYGNWLRYQQVGCKCRRCGKRVDV